ncbi:MAG: hypothetical protein Q9208_008275 [Pyrenodesmia sp. 3 TL-2023]
MKANALLRAFYLVTGVASTYNWVLQEAHDYPGGVNLWWWYLATLDYRDAPHKEADGTHTLGTPTPVDPSFSSPFAGKNLEDVAQWLRGKPQTVNVDDRFFGVLDKQVAESGKIPICRLNDPKVEKEVAWCILRDADYSTLYLAGLDSDVDWQENVQFEKYTLDL